MPDEAILFVIVEAWLDSKIILFIFSELLKTLFFYI